jgi:hypothetical protein
MLKELDDYSWGEAFGYAGELDTCANRYGDYSKVTHVEFTTEKVHTSPFNREDVVEIIAMSEGENDGPNWLIVGHLNDGRYFSLDAGCDYTGWDCQANGFAQVAATKDDIIRLGLGDPERKRLCLTLGIEMDGR